MQLQEIHVHCGMFNERLNYTMEIIVEHVLQSRMCLTFLVQFKVVGIARFEFAGCLNVKT